jgi:anaerobic magnesium-protoporphyrin IX monomethyl ester cyclase
MSDASARNVLLVNPPPTLPVGILAAANVAIPPVGLLYLAAALRLRGYCPAVLDMRLRSNDKAIFLQALERLRPRLVGFYVMTDYVSNALRLARLVKSFDPACQVVFGGPHPEYRATEILNTGVVDVVAIKGDGEQLLGELCDRAWTGSPLYADIDGIVFKDGGEIVETPRRPLIMDLDLLPWPAWDLLRLKDYHVPLVHTTRGCVGHCKFCCEGEGIANRVRFRSIPHIAAEISYLYERGVRRISFSDDNFVTGRKRLQELCLELSTRFPDLTWTCETRVDTTTSESIRTMAAAGCVSVHFGVESISRQTLDHLGKRFRLDQLEERIATADALGLITVLTFVVGLPNETEAQIRESFAYALEVRKKYRVMFAFAALTPYPGSEYGNHPERYGIQVHSRNYDNYNTMTPIISTPHLSRKRLQNLLCEIILEQARSTPERADPRPRVEPGMVDELGRLTVVQDAFKYAPFYPERMEPPAADDGHLLDGDTSRSHSLDASVQS